jgi:hypothetical protein
MGQRKISDFVTAACGALRNESSSIESELRQALEDGDWIICFADQWGLDCVTKEGCYEVDWSDGLTAPEQ